MLPLGVEDTGGYFSSGELQHAHAFAPRRDRPLCIRAVPPGQRAAEVEAFCDQHRSQYRQCAVDVVLAAKVPPGTHVDPTPELYRPCRRGIPDFDLFFVAHVLQSPLDSHERFAGRHFDLRLTRTTEPLVGRYRHGNGPLGHDALTARRANQHATRKRLAMVVDHAELQLGTWRNRDGDERKRDRKNHRRLRGPTNRKDFHDPSSHVSSATSSGSSRLSRTVQKLARTFRH